MKKSTRSIRIPDDLYETIAAMAEQQDRTVSNMIIVLLKRAVERPNVAMSVAGRAKETPTDAS